MEQKKLPKDLTKKAKLLELAGDETRIKILCKLFEKDNVCVSDMSKFLNMSVAAVSHHLLLMQESGLLNTVRQGKNICYSLNKTPLTKYIQQFICYQEK
ncbi:MAG: winged helix-turn-helix transcriptional regulator [Candidatus Doudnabacteria bacterium]|nr:winged helix-turn-helix transcriptional regulator [Candidatus Doudnabacteria bacterium]